MAATRRQLIRALGALTAAAPLAACVNPPAPRRLDRFGLQLSTLTPLLLADFPGTLRAVAAIGYRQVEFSAMGFLGREVAEVQALLQETALEAPVGRISPVLPPEFFTLDRPAQMRLFGERSGPAYLLDNVRAGIASARRLGQRDLVLPAMMPDQFATLSDVDRNIALMRQAGEICAAEGLRFGYHNHDWELKPIDGVVPWERMIEETDPAQVTFQLDAYWVVKGGGDLQGYLQRYPGRFSSCHMKDIDEGGDFADVGDGTIDFPAFTRAAIAAGAQHFFVERDRPPQPMQSARRSYAYLSQMTF